MTPISRMTCSAFGGTSIVGLVNSWIASSPAMPSRSKKRRQHEQGRHQSVPSVNRGARRGEIEAGADQRASQGDERSKAEESTSSVIGLRTHRETGCVSG